MTKSALFTVRSNESCPRYEAELIVRSGKHGPFLGRSRYPVYGYARPLKFSADGHTVKVLEGQVCPTCGANLVLCQGCFGVLVGCSDYPECEHIKLIDRPDEIVIAYPQCRTDHLVQHRSRYGKTPHSRDRYPECQLAISFKPIAEECSECHYPLLVEKKTAQSVKRFCAGKQCGKLISAE